MLLSDASLLCWIQLIAVMLINDVHAVINSLSDNFSDRGVEVNHTI
jgi:hypothetical protein